ncbi:PLP-dependent cysteine synthase family protein [Nocardia huaxiensis]|uniref:PLP-dependent cysteine synthase family protein n=1 Tax=Nocardia huaxiensis TaxID=2755382 RepID=UPI003B834CE5
MTDLIGRTPLLELAVHPRTGTKLFLKLETMNPTGAAKIRMARAMVLDAERRDLLPPGGHIIESTSGNTGLGLAVVACERGYRFTAVVDHHACTAKLNAMKAMGTELVFVAEDGDGNLATSAREELAAELAAAEGPTAHFPAQHDNLANGIGYHALAEELADDLERIDILVGAVGTGGSLFGTAEGLRTLGREPRLIGVEPEGSIAFGGPAHDYWQSGTGTPLGADPGIQVDRDLHLIEERDRVKVSDVDAFAAARVLGAELGLLIGGSSGSSVYAALTRLADFPERSTVVVVINDDGEKYLDTVFDDGWMGDRDLLDQAKEAEIAALLREYAVQHRTGPADYLVLHHLYSTLPDAHATALGLTGPELRAYADQQVPEAKLIHMLRMADLTMDEIGEVLAAGAADTVAVLERRLRQREERVAVLAQLITEMKVGRLLDEVTAK